MGEVDEKLKEMLSEDDYELLLEFLSLPKARIRAKIESLAKEVEELNA